mgnify:CR=1 FL=1
MCLVRTRIHICTVSMPHSLNILTPLPGDQYSSSPIPMATSRGCRRRPPRSRALQRSSLPATSHTQQLALTCSSPHPIKEAWLPRLRKSDAPLQTAQCHFAQYTRRQTSTAVTPYPCALFLRFPSAPALRHGVPLHLAAARRPLGPRRFQSTPSTPAGRPQGAQGWHSNAPIARLAMENG